MESNDPGVKVFMGMVFSRDPKYVEEYNNSLLIIVKKESEFLKKEEKADYIWDFILLWGGESNFGDYLPIVQPLISQVDQFAINVKEEMEGGKMKFIRRR